MNARQKVKQLKKENELLKKCLNPHINLVKHSHVKPEILKMKYLLEPFEPEEIVRGRIQKSIGRCLMESGFLDIKKEEDLLSNRTECTVSIMAIKNPYDVEVGG